MADEKSPSFCTFCGTMIPYGQPPCCTTTNLCPACTAPKTARNSNCCTGPSKRPPALREVSFHPPEWPAERIIQEMNRYTGSFPVVFCRPAQGAWERARYGEGDDVYVLPSHQGYARKGWLWTNWRGQVVESWVEPMRTGEIRQIIHERRRGLRAGILELDKGWFYFLDEDRGYANYTGLIGSPSDGWILPAEVVEKQAILKAADNMVVDNSEASKVEDCPDSNQGLMSDPGEGSPGGVDFDQVSEDGKGALKRDGNEDSDGPKSEEPPFKMRFMQYFGKGKQKAVW